MERASTGRGDRVLLVLAGGRSSRFGRDKALAPFGDDQEPLASRALRRLAPLARERALLRSQPFDRLPAGVLRLADRVPGAGPLAALAAAFERLPAESWCVAPCDAPWLAPEHYRRMEEARGRAPVAAARTIHGVEPLVSLWTRPAAETLRRWVDAEPHLAVQAALERLGVRWVDFAETEAFCNVNTPVDHVLALAMEEA